MVKYEKSSIYKICCKDVSVKGEYVGSTTNMQRRKTLHKSCCNNENGEKYNMIVYSYIRDNGGWDNFDFIEVEKFNATDKNHLHTRERYWIELLKSELNCCIPMRTQKEWYIDNKEHSAERSKKYYEDNREYFIEKQKIYSADNKEQIAEKHKKYYEDNREYFIEKQKIYYEDNREKIAEKGKEYRGDNKEQIAERDSKRKKKKVTCQCGVEMNKSSLTTHLKSKKHIAYIQSIQL